MAEGTAGRGIEIIGALQEAGLLRLAGPTDPTAQIIGALSEAGLLGTPAPTGETAAVGHANAEPVFVAPAPKVDDEAFLGEVTRIETSLKSGAGQVVLFNDSPLQWKGEYMIDFPPNSKDWIPDIDRIIAARGAGLSVAASVKITAVSAPGAYVGMLQLLRAQFRLG